MLYVNFLFISDCFTKKFVCLCGKEFTMKMDKCLIDLLMNTKALTHKGYWHKHFRTNTSAHFCTSTFSHTISHNLLYTPIHLHTMFPHRIFSRRQFYTGTLLHGQKLKRTDFSTHRPFWTQTLFTHGRFDTQTTLVHAETFRHTDASTHKRLYTRRNWFLTGTVG